MSDALHGYDRFAARVLKEWKVNGAAVAVVRGDEVLLSEGFGLRDVEGSLPVTPHTLFPLASVTKAFTTASLAILADDGLLEWDTPVRRYLPEFRLGDAAATELITPRDLVTHRSGLPRHDLLWYGSDATREDLVRRLRYLQPTVSFRSRYQYQNLMYMTAGYLAGRVSGTTWEDVVRSRLLEPLGMVSTTFHADAALEAPDHAKPYAKLKGKVREIPVYREGEALGPAGALISTVADMTQWLRLHLGGGSLDGKRIVSESQMREMHRPQMVYPLPGRWPEMPHQSYALGWFVQPYRGHAMLRHSGNIDGYSTLASFLPDAGLGVVVLTNMNVSPVPYILSWNVYDRLLGLEGVPWGERYRADHDEMEQAGKRGRAQRAGRRVRGTRPSHPLDAYAGRYEHPGYGPIEVRREEPGLVLTYHGMDFPLQHYHYDTFVAELEQVAATVKIRFEADVRGDVDRLLAPMEPTVPDIVFTRAPDPGMHSHEFLHGLAGEYTYMGYSVPVTLGDAGLRIVLPEQPPYDLRPLHGTLFALGDLSDATIEFEVGGNGRAIAATVDQMGDTYTVRRR